MFSQDLLTDACTESRPLWGAAVHLVPSICSNLNLYDFCTMHLRTVKNSDFETIASWISDAAAARRWAGPLLSFPFMAAELPVALAIPGCETSSYCLVNDGHAPLGFGQHWVFQVDAVHLGRIIVDPNARGRGLGRVLCQYLIEAALDATRARAVTLRAYRDNATAVALYESLGFSEVAAESTDEVLFMRKAVS